MMWILDALIIGGFGTFMICMFLIDHEIGKLQEHNRRFIQACEKLK